MPSSKGYLNRVKESRAELGAVLLQLRPTPFWDDSGANGLRRPLAAIRQRIQAGSTDESHRYTK